MTPDRLTHGGESARGKRKTEHPLKINKPIHLLVMLKIRASFQHYLRSISGFVARLMGKGDSGGPDF